MSKTEGLIINIIRNFSKTFFTVLFTALSVITCAKSDNAMPDQQWAVYINSYTTGMISKDSMIRVMFNQDLIDQKDIGKNAGGIFEFDPGIKGKGEWSAPNEIVFIPEAKLTSGERYRVSLDLEDYIEYPEDADDFFFYFETIHQDFDFTLNGFRFSNLKDLSSLQFHGSVNTADIENTGNIKKILSAFQDNRKLNIVWDKDEERLQHGFVIENIKKEKETSQLFLKWDGSTIDIDKNGEKKIAVPAKGVFEVTDVQAIIRDEQYISITFSEPLKKNQNLTGLITLQDNTVRTTIENNIIRAYPLRNAPGEKTLFVSKGIRNTENRKLIKDFSGSVKFESIKPGVRFTGKGTILPSNDKLTVSFEAVNIDSVQVTAFEIYSDNLSQFFQVNDYDGKNELKRVGRYLWRKTINLNNSPEEQSKWSRYSLDVTELFKKFPSSMFRLTLSINRSNSGYKCPGNTEPPRKEPDLNDRDDWNVKQGSYWDYLDYYYNYNSEDWKNRNNPCFDGYYNPQYNKHVISSKNFIASNIGIIAKQGEGNTIHIITTDIRTAEPISAKIKIYNYQNQLLAESETGNDGIGEIEVDKKPFLLIAENNDDKGYLRLSGESALIISHFDVGGVKVRKGVKGFIYGERGVWRPGDKIYLTFVLEDKNDTLPDNHPLSMDLYNPSGQLVNTMNEYRKTGDFYAFEIATDEKAPTGTWNACVRLGGLEFKKELRIETVIPNRLRINLNIDEKELHSSKLPVRAGIFAQWLHGGLASNLNTDVSVSLNPANTSFTRFKDYTFQDTTRIFRSDKTEIFSGSLDAQGNVTFPLDIPVNGKPAGMLNANFVSRVFEGSGAYSIETFSIPFHPYKNYIGIRTPKGDVARGMLLTDVNHTVNIASVNSFGSPVSVNNIEVTLYKISWKYWWDKSGEDMANFASARGICRIAGGTVSTVNGEGKWKFMVKYPDWGRYLVRAYDPQSGHSSSKIIYIDWPGWAGRAREEKGAGATRLNFSSDKTNYTVGEKAVIFLPSASEGKALISIENGSRVLKQFWKNTKEGKNKFELELSKEMTPNVYVHVMLLQPHKDKNNDSPVRLYGAIPLLVDDPNTFLQPELTAPDEIKPASKTKISVKEKQGRSMTYTIAVVDEGLLGLTRFMTPDLRNEFYKREALGVKTWDIFDDVAGAYGGQLERILALGGGEGLEEKKRTEEKRFPPVVQFMGPFNLKSGKTNTHEIKMQKYIGAVRIMVVAGKAGAYGSAEKSVTVSQPLMMLATMQRILGPGENLTIPVSLFTKKKNMNVKIQITSDSLLNVISDRTLDVPMPEPGEQIVYFKAKTADKIGKAKISFKAISGKELSEQEIFIDVRSSNPEVSKVYKGVADPGKLWALNLFPHGIQNTNSAMIEISTIPPISLERRLNYLIRYPHGCLEQTVSSAFPQLYLSRLTELAPVQVQQIEYNIKACVESLYKFQLPDGSFSLWPGKNNPDLWVTSYTGYFLIEAQKLGYIVPASMLKSWQSFQRNQANSWKSGDKQSSLIQAFRLFTLAMAKSPASGAMNRMREEDNLSSVARWQLATAFKIVGQDEAAEELVKKDRLNISEYFELGNTYGSHIRDKAIILNGMAYLNKRVAGKELAEEISGFLSSDAWYSTQTTAFALIAISEFTGKSKASYNFSFEGKVGNKTQKYSSSTAIYRIPIANIPSKGVPVQIKNLDKSAVIYCTLTSKGSPAPGTEKPAANGISIYVDYMDINRNPVDNSNIQQGKDFVATVIVSNISWKDIENIALNYIVPSGWQIHNPRFENGISLTDVDYQDIRDDCVISYFSLKKGEKKRFSILLNASYEGKYYKPSVYAEAMYDASLNALINGKWLEVSK
ncbi:MAG: hypothetical protein JW864_05330 [Spirochaetes bacterium]|nr:hypothetical protein [Spirochaetota bacterium]